MFVGKLYILCSRIVLMFFKFILLNVIAVQRSSFYF